MAIFVPLVSFFALVFICARKRRVAAYVGGVERGTSPSQHYSVVSDHQIRHATVEKFLWEIRHENPFRFTPRQVSGFTRGYAH
jgi:hypothetical protein